MKAVLSSKDWDKLALSKKYVGPDIVADMDWVTICGIKVARPEHIPRSIWIDFWNQCRWII